MLAQNNKKSFALLPRKIISYFPLVKDSLRLKTPFVYSIPCECGRVYIGQSGRSIQLQIKKHNGYLRLAQPDKSAVAKHSINHDHVKYKCDIDQTSKHNFCLLLHNNVHKFYNNIFRPFVRPSSGCI
jgi:hypothetical protein